MRIEATFVSIDAPDYFQGYNDSDALEQCLLWVYPGEDFKFTSPEELAEAIDYELNGYPELIAGSDELELQAIDRLIKDISERTTFPVELGETEAVIIHLAAYKED